MANSINDFTLCFGILFIVISCSTPSSAYDWLKWFTWIPKDERPYPGFAYKKGREVVSLNQHNIAMDLRNIRGRKQGQIAPRSVPRNPEAEDVVTPAILLTRDLQDHAYQIIDRITEYNQHALRFAEDDVHNQVDAEKYAQFRQNIHRMLRKQVFERLNVPQKFKDDENEDKLSTSDWY